MVLHMDNNDWLSSDTWDVTWQGEPVITLEQLLAVAHSQFPGTDREVLTAFSRLPVFFKAPDRLARQVLNKIGRRVTFTADGTHRTTRQIPRTKRTKNRVFGGPDSIFKYSSSIMPSGAVGIGATSFYPLKKDRARVEWVNTKATREGHILSRVVDQLDYEFPNLLEKAKIWTVLFTTEKGAPPYMGGTFMQEARQIRILRNIKTKNRVGDLITVPRSQGQMYYSLLHGIGHALGDEVLLAQFYAKHVTLPPQDWVRTLEPIERNRWAYGVARFKIASVDRGTNPYSELFSEAFTDFIVSKTTNNVELDNWVKSVLSVKGILGDIEKMRSRGSPTPSIGPSVQMSDIENFLLTEGPEAGEGLSPNELNHVVAVYSTGRKR